MHTPFCPHGSADTLNEYAEAALRAGLDEISFTEHAPLPEGFHDPVPNQDSSMQHADLPAYLEACRLVKKEYDGHLKIRTGLEVDYIAGWERETTRFLNDTGPYLDDAILSVHFLRISSDYICMDFHEDTFAELIAACGSLEAVYRLYYETVLASAAADLGKWKPARLGHITLVRKFQKQFPRTFDDFPWICDVIDKAAEQNLALDVNTAGLYKPLCGEHYPPPEALKHARSKAVRLVYGSDAHKSSQVGASRAAVDAFFSEHSPFPR
jgi:histidinol-phosphatase (PHP family)